MASLSPDQAEGLRRLFVADVRRMIAMVSCGPAEQASCLAAQLAAALVKQGKKVLLLEEQLFAGRRHPFLKVAPEYDLDAVLHDVVHVEQAVVTTACGVDLLAGGGQSRTLTRPRMEARIGLVNAFYRLTGQYDVVLVSAPGDAMQSRPSFAWACQDVILLCGGLPDSMKQAYGLIKLLHQSGERRFHLLFSEMDSEQSEAFYRRVAMVSRRHLQLMPGDLGVLPDNAPFPESFVSGLAAQVYTWPLPQHQAGHFPALMRRLLRGNTARVLHS